MELINILIIIGCIITCLSWAKRKNDEITKHAVELNTDEESEKLYYENEAASEGHLATESDKEDLEEIAKLLNGTVKAILNKIMKMSAVLFSVGSLTVWFFLEENMSDIGQAVYFFVGSFGQMLIGYWIFIKHDMFDRKLIINSQFEKWRALDHIIKLNSYITLSNQALNICLFFITYYLATFFGIDIVNTSITDQQFEKFHRRF